MEIALNAQQQHFLRQLMRELVRESDRVFHIRRRTEEGLRSYIESGAVFENQAVDQLLSQLEQAAVALQARAVAVKSPTELALPVGPITITSPERMRLRQPEEKLDTTGVKEQHNARTPNATMMESLDTVQVQAVAQQIREALRQHGPMTLGGMVQHTPMQAGLEELVAYIRIAKAVGATTLAGKETLEVQDKQGVRLQASIPTYLLSAELFPDKLETLVV